MTHPNETKADPVRILKTHGTEDIHPEGFIRAWLDAATCSILVDGDEVLALIKKAGIVRNVEILKKPVKLNAKGKKKPAIASTVSARSESNVRFLVENYRKHAED
jgi:hypothetical protein